MEEPETKKTDKIDLALEKINALVHGEEFADLRVEVKVEKKPKITETSTFKTNFFAKEEEEDGLRRTTMAYEG